jgi:hypothetical protein
MYHTNKLQHITNSMLPRNLSNHMDRPARIVVQCKLKIERRQVGAKPQSNELTGGPSELVSTSVPWGSSHRRKSAACPKFDMVWLHCSLILWRGGG